MFDFFNNLPSRVKAFLAIALLGLVAVGAIQLDFSPEKGQESAMTDVQIIIQTETGEPIPNVEVHIISKGAPTIVYTNTSGYVGVEIPERGDVDIQLFKEDYQTRYETINLVADPNRNRIFRLNETQNQSSKAIRYQHYTAQNDFLPLVLSILKPNLDIPIVKEVFSESMGINTIPFVYIGGPVSETVERFKRETGNVNKVDAYTKEIGFEYVLRNSESGLSERGTIRKSTPNSDYEVNTIQVTQEEAEFKRYAESLIRGEEDYFHSFYFSPILSSVKTDDSYASHTSFIKTDYLSGGVDGYIFQYPKLGDLKGLTIKDELSEATKRNNSFEIDDRWIQNIMSANPDTRGFIAFSYPYSIDGLIPVRICPPFSQGVMFRHTPSPYLKFIDIENDTEAALTVDSVSFRLLERNQYDLTVVDQRNFLFKDIPVQDYGTNIVLEPGEHFLVPIEFGFSTDSIKSRIDYFTDIDSSEKKGVVAANSLYVAKPIPTQDIFSFSSSDVTSQKMTEYFMEEEAFSKDFLEASVSLENLNDGLPKRFSVGSVIDVAAISIDGETVPIDSPGNDPSVYISNLILGGSCPYLEVYDSNSGNWFDLGTVLTSRNNKELQQEEVHVIGSSNISKIRLEEREHEITFLDSIELTYIDAIDEKEHSAFLPHPELKQADNQYIKLFEGDSLEIDLTDLIPSSSYRIRLHVNGYYEPVV